MKLKIFIKDIIHNKNDIIIWLTREENYLLKDMKMIYDLLSFENNLHIFPFTVIQAALVVKNPSASVGGKRDLG